MKSFSGSNYIYQKSQKRKIKRLKREGITCAKILSDEEDKLISRLPAGKFVALTHCYLIKKLLAEECIQLTLLETAYTHDLRTTQNKMYGCKTCNKRKRAACEIRIKGDRVRQFYYIKFEKREGQPNVQG